MQIIHSFGISPSVYHRRGTDNDFPPIRVCPRCLYPGILTKHGFYWRNAVFLGWELRIPIRRYKCSSCHQTVSILPDFLLPNFQHGLAFIIKALHDFFTRGKRTICRQLLQFYRRRFLKNLNRIQAFFRDLGFKGVIGEKEKAIKLLEMIHAAFSKAETFAKRFQEHFLHNFMAN